MLSQLNMDRFENLPTSSQKFFLCMITLKEVPKRMKNYKKNHKKLPTLSMFDAVTPSSEVYKKEKKLLNLLTTRPGTIAIWISNILVFKYFLSTDHSYLVLAEDDVKLPANITKQIERKILCHPKFTKKGGSRLGPYASCIVYNRDCVHRILTTIKTHPIDRGIDHYYSNVGSGKRNIPLNVWLHDPGIVSLDEEVSKFSARRSLDGKLQKWEKKSTHFQSTRHRSDMAGVPKDKLLKQISQLTSKFSQAELVAALEMLTSFRRGSMAARSK